MSLWDEEREREALDLLLALYDVRLIKRILLNQLLERLSFAPATVCLSISQFAARYQLLLSRFFIISAVARGLVRVTQIALTRNRETEIVSCRNDGELRGERSRKDERKTEEHTFHRVARARFLSARLPGVRKIADIFQGREIHLRRVSIRLLQGWL